MLNYLPVMLTREESLRWMDGPQAIDLGGLMLELALKERLTLYPVDRAVSNTSNKDPGLFMPLPEPATIRPEGPH